MVNNKIIKADLNNDLIINTPYGIFYYSNFININVIKIIIGVIMQIIDLDKTNKNFFITINNGINIEDICEQYNVDEKLIMKSNPQLNKTLKNGDIIYLNKGNAKIYIVKPLDTIDKISEMFNVDKNYLIKTNNISNLFIGQKIYIE